MVTDRTNLKNLLDTDDLEKSQALLLRIAARPGPEKLEMLEALALAGDQTAFALLSFLVPATRTNPGLHDRLIQLVMDRAFLNPVFARILLSGNNRQAALHAAPLLKHILSNATDKSLLGDIIKAAGQLRIENLVDDIAEFIFYDDSDLKTAAVKALVGIRTPRACLKLDMAARTEKCDPDILNGLATLETALFEGRHMAPDAADSRSVTDLPEKTIRRLSSPDTKERFRALQELTSKGPAVYRCLSGLITNPSDHDLLINILRLIKKNLPRNAVKDLLTLVNHADTPERLKFAAYDALASFSGIESVASIVNGILEPSLHVRLAAMKVLDGNLSDFVTAAVKKRVEAGGERAGILVETVLDARAAHIIESLMISDAFSYLASNYLQRKAPVQVIDTFIEILEKRKLKSTAKKYQILRREKEARQKDRFIIISTSTAVLDVYRTLLNAAGYPCRTFQNPQNAFEAMVSQKPFALICDLFLDDMTGPDLTKEIRDLYSKEEMPVFISTLQNTLDRPMLQKKLDEAGVAELWSFPPGPDQIRSAVVQDNLR